jgi:hypothetical protein
VPVLPSAHSDDQSSAGSGSGFSEQFNGLTDSLPASRSKSSSGNGSTNGKSQQKKNTDNDAAPLALAGMPGVPAQTRPIVLQLPTEGSETPAETPVTNKKIAARMSTPCVCTKDPEPAPAFPGTPALDLMPGAKIALAALPTLTSANPANTTSPARPAQPAIAVNAAPAPAGGVTPVMPQATNTGDKDSRGEAGPSTAEAAARTAPSKTEAPQLEDMAFAARVSSPASAQQLSSQMAASAATSASTKKPVVPEAPATAAQPHPELLSQAASTAFQKNSELTTASLNVKAPAAPVAAASLEPAQFTTAAKPATALKDLTMQLAQPGTEKVDIRVVQQAGEVRVAVHTGDSDLAHGLRQGLSDLVGRLEENGYRAEAWRPVSVAPPVGAAAETNHTSGQSRNSDSQQQQSGGSPQDGGRRNQNQSNQPRWVEELESSMPAGGEFAGESHGLVN